MAGASQSSPTRMQCRLPLQRLLLSLSTLTTKLPLAPKHAVGSSNALYERTGGGQLHRVNSVINNFAPLRETLGYLSAIAMEQSSTRPYSSISSIAAIDYTIAMTDFVLYEQAERVVTSTLNRPE